MKKRWWAATVLPLAAAGLVAIPPPPKADAGVRVITSTLTAPLGALITATNHVVKSVPTSGPSAPGEFLLVWAGDTNAADLTVKGIPDHLTRLGSSVDIVRTLGVVVPDLLPGNDFLAVIDADKGSPTYGKVVNTVTVAPLVENEPHHMQYIWHKGDRVFAGGLFSATTYVFDITDLPVVKLAGASLPTDTPCGSVPDAYWTLKDGTAYGTYMGGPVVPGPCIYDDGSVAIGNGFAGTPGEVVRFDRNGKVLSENKATTDTPADTDPIRCVGVPTIVPSCANPHGIQVREDLNRMITTDYAEPKNVVADPLRPLSPNLFRDTVRIWDITDRNRPKVVSVSVMPDGPRKERNPGHEEPRGIMEGTVTNLPQHKGAFSSSMCGGVIYYTPDITLPNPVWREVFDDTTASKAVNPNTESAGCAGGGWVQTSLDDKYLYRAVIGRNPGDLGPTDPGVAKMVYTLDIQALLKAGVKTTCNIDKIAEVRTGGSEADCPKLVSVLPLPDGTSGGPHWGTLDNFVRNGDGTYTETTDVRRISVSNYFVARSTVDGNHKVCMVDVSAAGKLTLDETFVDENHGTPCVNFNRTDWPHGKTGDAKPHSQLFVVRNDRLRG